MAKTIMVQGTMSSAGKSLVAAGLCRIFRQDGYRTAPFKSQNMALNSFITKEGLEMGRAQVMQAEAAGIEPSADMNPVLLKPTNDTQSQVIVHGEVLKNMSAADYFAYKQNLVPEIMAAFGRLSRQYDIVVIEGAGSPAEINLKDHDIVNMGMAERADAPVLLVGDIDRGGVFAQLVGTLELLEKNERRRVKGLVINKFRGDVGILEPGIRMLEEKTGVPVIGTVPYLHLHLEDEDSLTERFGHRTAARIDIAVIRLPRISNFTDFDVFENIPGVSLRYIGTPEELGEPDMIILPGSKNTMADLKWMRQCGLEAAVCKASAAGTVIFGICGGYQMLGETLSDPDGIEDGGELRGMGLLPLRTVLRERKVRTRVTGCFAGDIAGTLSALRGRTVEGYEIHMGVTEGAGAPLCRLRDTISGQEKADGAVSASRAADGSMTDSAGKTGDVYGSYVHGIFDAGDIAAAVVRALAEKKGIDIDTAGFSDYQAFREEQYDRLADALRASLDMKAVYGFMGMSGKQEDAVGFLYGGRND